MRLTRLLVKYHLDQLLRLSYLTPLFFIDSSTTMGKTPRSILNPTLRFLLPTLNLPPSLLVGTFTQPLPPSTPLLYRGYLLLLSELNQATSPYLLPPLLNLPPLLTLSISPLFHLLLLPLRSFLYQMQCQLYNNF